MNRRNFFTRLAGGAAGAGLLSADEFLWASRRRQVPLPATADKRQRISLSTWSLHNYFQATREKDFNQPGDMLALLDFPELAADKYKLHNMEFCAPHFASTEATYLQELKNRLARAHSRVVNIPVDIEEIWTKGGLSDPDPEVRGDAISAAKKWIDIAKTIGSKAVRCDPGKMNAQDLGPTVASYKALESYGKSKGVQVIIENHGGVGSEHPEELVKLFKDVGDNLGAVPDFANFPDEATRERGLTLLFPFAHVVCHAKGLEFDADGNETRFDFPKCVEISKQAGFKGVYSIEFEGPGDPYAGCQRVLDNLLKYL